MPPKPLLTLAQWGKRSLSTGPAIYVYVRENDQDLFHGDETTAMLARVPAGVSAEDYVLWEAQT
jgi:hypothetical protein